jgi:alkanesulfonate monooxygenase SsuD/methylene tetrahydromethanopterin reductase-like flavin-dependent oxidoreductase (luciferase family)
MRHVALGADGSADSWGGALVVGSPEEVAEKILFEHGLFRHQGFMAQISVGTMAHEKVMRAIELFGTEVVPAVRKELSRQPGSI